MILKQYCLISEKKVKMAIKCVLLRIDSDFYSKLVKKAKTGSYKNVQEYLLAVAHRDFIQSHKNAGKKKVIGDDQFYMSKFATPTKKTFRTIKLLKSCGIEDPYSI